MGRLVMKFGGTSVANIERIGNVARHVKREVDAGHDVAVIVSAMAGKTNELVEWCREASAMHDAREYDVVVASGEQVTAGLLAIALQTIGVQARSWQGWQIPIKTSDAHASARILEIDGTELINRFKDRKEVAVITGFQGINPQTNRITTLGRGGSDTSAVAIAAAIRADRCDIYTDVDGVYTTDPRVVPKARRLDKIAFEDMLELASQGAKVLQVRSVELGMVHNMPIFVRSSFDKPEDIDPRGTPPGTLICSEEEIMESHVVTGIAFSKDEAQISVRQIEDKPGVAAAIFGPLADANINVDMIVQNVSEDGRTTDLTFTVPASDYARARDTITSAKARIAAATATAEVSEPPRPSVVIRPVSLCSPWKPAITATSRRSLKRLISSSPLMSRMRAEAWASEVRIGSCQPCHERISFEEMLELASLGAQVLQVRSVELGMVHNVRIFVRSSFDKPEDIDPHDAPPGTLICNEEEIVEQHVVTGIAFSKDEAQISVRQIEDKPGVAAAIFGPLADANINVDMIVQNVSEDGKTTDLTFTVPASDYARARDTINSAKARIGYARLDSATDIAKVSVIGSGMRSHAGVAAKAFAALAARNINIRAITTSEIKFSVLIDTAYTELAVRTLHTLYGLDQV